MEVLDGVVAQASDAARAGTLRALLVESGRPDSFIAGADVTAIAAVAESGDREIATGAVRAGQALFARIAALPVPTVAAIQGICLGGGKELALACDYRVCDDDDRTRIGLPEVQLGILPAWGGTTRLPRLVGLRGALGLMLTGKPARVSKARRIGPGGPGLPTPAIPGKEPRVHPFAGGGDGERWTGATGGDQAATRDLRVAARWHRTRASHSAAHRPEAGPEAHPGSLPGAVEDPGRRAEGGWGVPSRRVWNSRPGRPANWWPRPSAGTSSSSSSFVKARARGRGRTVAARRRWSAWR